MVSSTCGRRMRVVHVPLPRHAGSGTGDGGRADGRVARLPGMPYCAALAVSSPDRTGWWCESTHSSAGTVAVAQIPASKRRTVKPSHLKERFSLVVREKSAFHPLRRPSPALARCFDTEISGWLQHAGRAGDDGGLGVRARQRVCGCQVRASGHGLAPCDFPTARQHGRCARRRCDNARGPRPAWHPGARAHAAGRRARRVWRRVPRRS